MTVDYESLVASARRLPDNVVAAWLYGSVARGTATRRSDVDVAVLVRVVPPPTLEAHAFDVQFALESGIGASVDLVVMNDAPVDLVHRVLRDGRLVLDRDPTVRVRFEVKTRNEYFDLLPVLRRYRRFPREGGDGTRTP